MSTKKTVELFYDVLSPYAWLGFEGICRYQYKWNISLQLRPFLLGAAMVSSGNIRPPGEQRKKYTRLDLKYMREYCQVPIHGPKDFGIYMQKGSLLPQRLLVAASLDAPDKLEDLTREMWMRIWSRDEDITETSSLLAACTSAGFTADAADKLVARIKDQEVKDKLRQNTDEALEHGAFGAPSFVIQGIDGKKHMVFGSDRLHIIAMLLGEKYEGPLNELAKTKL